jgi:hypothetical protein
MFYEALKIAAETDKKCAGFLADLEDFRLLASICRWISCLVILMIRHYYPL